MVVLIQKDPIPLKVCVILSDVLTIIDIESELILAVSGHCKYRSQNSGAKIHGYSKIPSGDEKLLQEALATIGPVRTKFKLK